MGRWSRGRGRAGERAREEPRWGRGARIGRWERWGTVRTGAQGEAHGGGVAVDPPRSPIPAVVRGTVQPPHRARRARESRRTRCPRDDFREGCSAHCISRAGALALLRTRAHRHQFAAAAFWKPRHTWARSTPDRGGRATPSRDHAGSARRWPRRRADAFHMCVRPSPPAASRPHVSIPIISSPATAARTLTPPPFPRSPFPQSSRRASSARLLVPPTSSSTRPR